MHSVTESGPDRLTPLRQQVREFLTDALPDRSAGGSLGGSHDPRFSRALAERGWVGMSIPREYGGAGAGAAERFVVVEELLAAGAPIVAHWIAERQIAPSLLRFGTADQQAWFLPRIAAGECWFSLGMSEPDAGSDLASVRTRAVRTDGGWRLTGTKVWTTNAHLNHFCMVLCRTSDEPDRHAGLSQLIVDLSAPGVRVAPIHLLDGRHHVNEVSFDDVLVPDDRVLGEIGAGWRQVTDELANERSGPDRYLSAFGLFRAYVAEVGASPDEVGAHAIGRLAARLLAIRRLSGALTRALDAGEPVGVAAALLKDIGTTFERETVEMLRDAAGGDLDRDGGTAFERQLAACLMSAPTWTLRGGTTEILRGIAAKKLTGGVR